MHFRTVSDTQWAGPCYDPYTMYIYSLRHFLTTKGALIDGDWGVSKNDPKTQKSDQKFIKKIKSIKNCHQKCVKNWSKKVNS